MCLILSHFFFLLSVTKEMGRAEGPYIDMVLVFFYVNYLPGARI